METNLLNKDKVWNRIKNYVYFIVFLFILLTIIAISCLVLNCCIYNKVIQTYTST